MSQESGRVTRLTSFKLIKFCHKKSALSAANNYMAKRLRRRALTHNSEVYLFLSHCFTISQASKAARILIIMQDSKEE